MYSLYNPNRRRRVQDVGPEPSATKQQFLAESDVNNIMARYRRTGLVNYVNQFSGEYADIPALDFHEAQNVLIRARTMYEALPADVRQRFPGPAEFLAFVQNDELREEQIKLGLRSPPARAPDPPAPGAEGGAGGTGA